MSDNNSLKVSRFAPAEPLWRLAPVRDAEGQPVADFMMVIPGLKRRGAAYRESVGLRIAEVCEGFADQVVFADLNTSTGALWLSVEAQPGLCARVGAAIHQAVPEALMVGGQLGAVSAQLTVAEVWRERLTRLMPGISRIHRRVLHRLSLSPPDSDAH